MVLHAKDIEEIKGRRPYELGGRIIPAKHFVTRVTTPENPFVPHKHENPELWFMLAGEAVVSLDGVDHTIVSRDLVLIDPWVEHGLRSDSGATWICLG